MVIEKCPHHEPLMIQAWADCLRWAINQESILAIFKADTGVEASSGTGETVAMEFVDWFNENIWGKLEGE